MKQHSWLGAGKGHQLKEAGSRQQRRGVIFSSDTATPLRKCSSADSGKISELKLSESVGPIQPRTNSRNVLAHTANVGTTHVLATTLIHAKANTGHQTHRKQQGKDFSIMSCTNLFVANTARLSEQEYIPFSSNTLLVQSVYVKHSADCQEILR